MGAEGEHLACLKAMHDSCKYGGVTAAPGPHSEEIVLQQHSSPLIDVQASQGLSAADLGHVLAARLQNTHLSRRWL